MRVWSDGQHGKPVSDWEERKVGAIIFNGLQDCCKCTHVTKLRSHKLNPNPYFVCQQYIYGDKNYFIISYRPSLQKVWFYCVWVMNGLIPFGRDEIDQS